MSRKANVQPTKPLSDVSFKVKNPIPKKKKNLRKSKDAPQAGPGGPGTDEEYRAGAGAPTAGKPIEKDDICMEILMEGFVQSYVDFFYLTHRPDPVPDPTREGVEREINVPLNEMFFIRDNLQSAERARRQGETRIVYESYNKLAQYFQEVNDCRTGIYFYEKCLEIARLTSDKHGEMGANHCLGLAHQSINDSKSAIMYHEKHLEIAQSLDDPGELNRANKELIKVYRRCAEEYETLNDYREAVSFHHKCLEASRATDDRISEGLAGYRIGRAYVLLNEPDRSIQHLNEYLSICKDPSVNDLEGQGAACSALAAAYQSLGSMDSAVQHLEQFLDIATKTDNLIAQGEACCNLGVIYNRRGEFAKAMQLFEKNFEIARSTVSSGQGDRKLVDVARVNLGMARGNAQMSAFVNVINFDIQNLLRWKNRRVKFEASLRK